MESANARLPLSLSLTVGEPMLYCGKYNGWVETALKYLPYDIFEKVQGKVAITILKSDACRLAQKIRNHNEIIVLSPWIFSFIPPGSSETDKEWKYLIFCLLHEVAHIIFKHSPPDEILAQENSDQEKEADRYAQDWFNEYASEHADRGMTGLTIQEIREQRENYQNKLESILSCG